MKYVIFLGDAKVAQWQTNLATWWKMFLSRHLFDSEKYKLLLWASIGPLRLKKTKFKRKMIHLNLTREGGVIRYFIKARRELEPKFVPQLLLGSLFGTRRSAIGQ